MFYYKFKSTILMIKDTLLLREQVLLPPKVRGYWTKKKWVGGEVKWEQSNRGTERRETERGGEENTGWGSAPPRAAPDLSQQGAPWAPCSVFPKQHDLPIILELPSENVEIKTNLHHSSKGKEETKLLNSHKTNLMKILSLTIDATQQKHHPRKQSSPHTKNNERTQMNVSSI